MKITLNKFFHCARMSEETYCFSAVICIDGRPCFEASNEGHGGTHRYYPINTSDVGVKLMHDSLAAIESYAATLPPIDFGEGHKVPHNTETVISSAVTDTLEAKRKAKFTRELRTKVYLIDGTKLLVLKLRKGYFWDDHLKVAISRKYPAAQILNLLTVNEAWSLAKATLGFPS